MDLDVCRAKCKHYRDATVFELCQHPKSTYSIEGKPDFHTITHMRAEHRPCGPEASLMERERKK